MWFVEFRGARFAVARRGFVPPGDSRSEEEPNPAEVAAAKQYLTRNWVPAKTARRSSYLLKHMVERAGGGYCSNGALIAAAVELGLRVEPVGFNGLVYVKKGGR